MDNQSLNEEDYREQRLLGRVGKLRCCVVGGKCLRPESCDRVLVATFQTAERDMWRDEARDLQAQAESLMKQRMDLEAELLAVAHHTTTFPRVYFDFNDWWIGAYRGPNHWYVCLLPCVVIRWRRA